ncbi:MAG: hypothetical protein SNI81_08140 [Rikenellaceae bacterium]
MDYPALRYAPLRVLLEIVIKFALECTNGESTIARYKWQGLAFYDPLAKPYLLIGFGNAFVF